MDEEAQRVGGVDLGMIYHSGCDGLGNHSYYAARGLLKVAKCLLSTYLVPG